jgi:hypothetical protein
LIPSFNFGSFIKKTIATEGGDDLVFIEKMLFARNLPPRRIFRLNRALGVGRAAFQSQWMQ